MIVSFADHATAELFNGTAARRAKRVPPDVTRIALRKLDMLDAAVRLIDLRVPPGNRLEALRGDFAGLHSIRVNDQWRLVFRWTERGPAEVRLIDYH